jgi:hypothetical protein
MITERLKHVIGSAMLGDHSKVNDTGAAPVICMWISSLLMKSMLIY